MGIRKPQGAASGGAKGLLETETFPTDSGSSFSENVSLVAPPNGVLVGCAWTWVGSLNTFGLNHDPATLNNAGSVVSRFAGNDSLSNSVCSRIALLPGPLSSPTLRWGAHSIQSHNGRGFAFTYGGIDGTTVDTQYSTSENATSLSVTIATAPGGLAVFTVSKRGDMGAGWGWTNATEIFGAVGDASGGYSVAYIEDTSGSPVTVTVVNTGGGNNRISLVGASFS